jgi:hypothetical protein
MMADPSQEPQQYWQILIPAAHFPKPKFHFNQQVALHWKDDLGNHLCDVGVIVGMQYAAMDNEKPEWSYRIRLTKCDYNPQLVGSYDCDFQEEFRFVVDDMAIAD